MLEKDFDRVLVDVCSFCEGIYCDPGELEKLFLRRQEQRTNLVARLLGLK
jgi:Zn-finger nucleic acid-binding protein